MPQANIGVYSPVKGPYWRAVPTEGTDGPVPLARLAAPVAGRASLRTVCPDPRHLPQQHLIGVGGGLAAGDNSALVLIHMGRSPNGALRRTGNRVLYFQDQPNYRPHPTFTLG